MDTLERMLVELDALRRRVEGLETLEHTSGWTDYSSTSTITGWGSFTTQLVLYKTIEGLVFCQFNLQGVSNSTAVTFTLPITQSPSMGGVNVIVRIMDNSAAYTSGLATMAVSSSLVNGYPTPNGGNWTASNNKRFIGQFWYLRA